MQLPLICKRNCIFYFSANTLNVDIKQFKRDSKYKSSGEASFPGPPKKENKKVLTIIVKN